MRTTAIKIPHVEKPPSRAEVISMSEALWQKAARLRGELERDRARQMVDAAISDLRLADIAWRRSLDEMLWQAESAAASGKVQLRDNADALDAMLKQAVQDQTALPEILSNASAPANDSFLRSLRERYDQAVLDAAQWRREALESAVARLRYAVDTMGGETPVDRAIASYSMAIREAFGRAELAEIIRHMTDAGEVTEVVYRVPRELAEDDQERFRRLFLAHNHVERVAPDRAGLVAITIRPEVA